MITFAIEQEAEQAAWDIWVAVYPNFSPETFVPFSEFKNAQLKARPPATQKSWEEITQEMDAVVQRYEEKKRGENT